MHLGEILRRVQGSEVDRLEDVLIQALGLLTVEGAERRRKEKRRASQTNALVRSKCNHARCMALLVCRSLVGVCVILPVQRKSRGHNANVSRRSRIVVSRRVVRYGRAATDLTISSI